MKQYNISRHCEQSAAIQPAKSSGLPRQLRFLVMTALLAVTSCASIIEGDMQAINVTTSPSFPSDCIAKGQNLDAHFTAPGSVSVPKSKYPVEITCTPSNGSAAGTAKVLSDIGAWGYGGSAATLGVGAIVDSTTGAANKYPDSVTIPLGQTTVIGKTSMNSNADFNQ